MFLVIRVMLQGNCYKEVWIKGVALVGSTANVCYRGVPEKLPWKKVVELMHMLLINSGALIGNPRSSMRIRL